MNFNAESGVGNVGVLVTNNGNHSPEEWAEMAADQIIFIGGNSHPVIVDQARAFRKQIVAMLTYYFTQVQNAERADISRRL
jgi:carbonic anhydrase